MEVATRDGMVRGIGLPWGLLAMVVLVAAVEGFCKSQEDGPLASPLRESWRFAGRAAARQAARSSVLSFGDSLVKFGVSPGVLQSVTGLPAYNLAAYGGPPSFSLHALERAIEAGARPRALILSFLPANLAMPPRYYLQNGMLSASPWECLDLAITARDGALFGELIAGRLLPSVRRRYEIRDWSRSALLGRVDAGEPARLLASRRLEWRKGRGGERLPAGPPRRIEADPTDPNLFPTFWAWDQAQGKYFERFLDRADALGVPVFYLLAPLPPAVQDLRERTGLDTWHTEIVRRVKTRHPGLIVVDARYCRYPDSAFFDTAHLNALGAERLSRDLAEVIRLALDGSSAPPAHWVNLPNHREEPAGNQAGSPALARSPGAETSRSGPL
jgi:hypothetical protein